MIEKYRPEAVGLRELEVTGGWREVIVVCRGSCSAGSGRKEAERVSLCSYEYLKQPLMNSARRT